MDPLSIVAASTSIAVSAGKVSHCFFLIAHLCQLTSHLYLCKAAFCLDDIISKVKDVDKSVASLSRELRSLKQAAIQTKNTLSHGPKLLTGPSAATWEHVEQHIRSCTPALQGLERLLLEISKDKPIRTGILRKPMTALSLARRIHEISEYRNELRSHTAALQLGLAAKSTFVSTLSDVHSPS